MKLKYPTQERLKSILDYDQITGIFRWKVSPHPEVMVGDIAGTINALGYRYIGVDNSKYGAHRLAWLYVYGVLPAQIDHIDLDRSNNAIANLRAADNAKNNQNRTKQSNNTSGYKGVYFHKAARKWCAEIKSYGVKRYLGLFDKKEDANAAYVKAAFDLHGEFARTS